MTVRGAKSLFLQKAHRALPGCPPGQSATGSMHGICMLCLILNVLNVTFISIHDVPSGGGGGGVLCIWKTRDLTSITVAKIVQTRRAGSHQIFIILKWDFLISKDHENDFKN